MNNFGRTVSFTYNNRYEDLMDYIEIKLINVPKEFLKPDYIYYLMTKTGFDYIVQSDDREYIRLSHKDNQYSSELRKLENERIKSDKYTIEDDKIILPIFPKKYIEMSFNFMKNVKYKTKLFIEFGKIDDILTYSKYNKPDTSNSRLEFRFCNFPNKINRANITLKNEKPTSILKLNNS